MKYNMNIFLFILYYGSLVFHIAQIKSLLLLLFFCVLGLVSRDTLLTPLRDGTTLGSCLLCPLHCWLWRSSCDFWYHQSCCGIPEHDLTVMVALFMWTWKMRCWDGKAPWLAWIIGVRRSINSITLISDACASRLKSILAKNQSSLGSKSSSMDTFDVSTVFETFLSLVGVILDLHTHHGISNGRDLTPL